MERTPSKERGIPIEILGTITDVSDEDIDELVESENSHINMRDSSRSQSTPATTTSNRASLIITHEDGTTEENECLVTCLGVSSDSSETQGLTIEEISNDTLKGKLKDDKLKVIIPDMSQVVISENDEVTDASFVSTPEAENVQSITDMSTIGDFTDTNEINVKVKKEPVILSSPSEVLQISEVQKCLVEVELEHKCEVPTSHKDKESVLESGEIQLVTINGDITHLLEIEKEETSQTFQLNHGFEKDDNVVKTKPIDADDSMSENSDATIPVAPEHETSLTEIVDELSMKMIEADALEISNILRVQNENIQQEQVQIKIASTSQAEEHKYADIGGEKDKNKSMKLQKIGKLTKNVDEIEDDQSIDLQLLQCSEESTNKIQFEQVDTTYMNQSFSQNKSEQIQSQSVKKENAKTKNSTVETVRIIPISLPNGRYVEKSCLSIDQKLNISTNLIEIENLEVKKNNTSTDLVEIENLVVEKNMAEDKLAKSCIGDKWEVPIKIESKESPSNFETSRDEDIKTEEKENSDIIIKEETPTENVLETQLCNKVDQYSQKSSVKLCQSTERLSEMSKVGTFNEENRKESEMCENSTSETSFSKIERKLSTCDITEDITKLNDELTKKEKHSNVDYSQLNKNEVKARTNEIIKEESFKAIENKTFQPICENSSNVRAVPIQRSHSSDMENEICNESKIADKTVQEHHEIPDKNKQTEVEANWNTCSVTPSVLPNMSNNGEMSTFTNDEHTNSDLINNTNSQLVRSIPIQIQIHNEDESEDQIKSGSIKDEISKPNTKNKECEKKLVNVGQNLGITTERVESKSTEKGEFIEQQKLKYLQRKTSETPLPEQNMSTIKGQTVRNIEIQIQTNAKDEGESNSESKQLKNKQISEHLTKPEECENKAEGGIQKRNNITEGTSIKLTKEMDFEEKQSNISGKKTSSTVSASDQNMSPLVRTVPIQIIRHSCDNNHGAEQTKGYTSNEAEISSENQAGKTNNVRNIPIQRISLKSDELTNKCQQTLNRDIDCNLLNESLIEESKHGLLTVPIQREISQGQKKNNIENIQKEKDTKKLPNPSSQTNISKENSGTFKQESHILSDPAKLPPGTSASSSKPPQAIRSVPILRQSLSDSGAGLPKQKPGVRHRNASDQPAKEDILQRVHAELEEARAKFNVQANSLSSGLENIVKPDYGKSDARSRSLESEQRNLGAKPKNARERFLFKRERSLQDIDKDIETIWKELQELDMPIGEKNVDDLRKSRYPDCAPSAPSPLSEQVLVTPSWRSPTPPPPLSSFRTSLSNPNLSQRNTYCKSLSTSKEPHTIWDNPVSDGPKYEPTPVGQLSSSWDNKPQYFPSKSATHFSFLPKAETKPGAITPNYANKSKIEMKSSFINVPIVKPEKDELLETTFPIHPENVIKSNTMSRVEGKKTAINSSYYKSEETLKSCLKSETAFSAQPIKNRSESPSNVRFSSKIIAEPKIAVKLPKTNEKSFEPDPPFEWVNFRKSDGEIVKGTILPPLHREKDVIIAKEVPIINVLLDDAMKEDTETKPALNNKSAKAKVIESQEDSEEEKSKLPKETFNACDAGTQTEKSDKKGGCFIM